MVNKKYNFVLGSASPRRRELIQSLYLNHSIETSDIEENSTQTDVEKMVMDLARQKAMDVFEKTNVINPFVLGADTLVVYKNEVLGKPQNQDEAKKMLRFLSDKTHTVLTGVSFYADSIDEVFYGETQVSFDKISEDMLTHYLATGESLDKAGAYGIQGKALSFIKNVQGSYSNVVGLPVCLVHQKLKSLLTNEKDFEGKWRQYFV